MSSAGGALIGEPFVTYVQLRTPTHDRLLRFQHASNLGGYDETINTLLALAEGKADPATRGLIRHAAPWRFLVLCAACPFERVVRGRQETAATVLEEHWSKAHEAGATER